MTGINTFKLIISFSEYTLIVQSHIWWKHLSAKCQFGLGRWLLGIDYKVIEPMVELCYLSWPHLSPLLITLVVLPVCTWEGQLHRDATWTSVQPIIPSPPGSTRIYP